jgi:general secretion pathway protein N
MIAGRLPRLRPNHALGALVVLGAAAAVWPWIAPPVPAVRASAPPTAKQAPPAVAPLPPLASYAATIERPLFAPSRRPAPGAAAAPSSETRFRLLGVVATGAKRRAFLADGTRRIEAAEGEVVDGWTIKQIGQDRVLLTSPAGETTLKLKAASVEPPKSQ